MTELARPDHASAGIAGLAAVGVSLFGRIAAWLGLMGPQADAQRKNGLGRRSSRRDWLIAILIGLTAVGIYNANLRSITSGDTYPARYLPLSIWQGDGLIFEETMDLVAQGRSLPESLGVAAGAYWIVMGPDGHMVSRYPIVTPLLVTPLYGPAYLYLNATGWEPGRVDEVARLMEKLCASLLAAGSAALVYLLLRRRTDVRIAAALAVVYAFGTATWVVSSQALWAHGSAQLFIAACLLLMTGPATTGRIVVAGLLCGLIAANRQPDTLLAAGLALYGLWWSGRRAPILVVSAAAPALLALAWNLAFLGYYAGGFYMKQPAPPGDGALSGLAGLLFSPSHGLFVFSPFLLFIPACLPLVVLERRARVLTLVVGGAALCQLLFYSPLDWRQGVSWGPRWLADMLPILMFMLPPVLAGLSRRLRILFWVACGASVAIHAIGAFWYTGMSDAIVMTGQPPDRMKAAWDVRNAPFLADLAHPPVGSDLLLDFKGAVSSISARPDAGTEDASVTVEISGWASVDDAAPVAVVGLVDGERQVAEDPNPGPHDGPGRAWRILAPEGLSPGRHTLSILVQARPGGEPRWLLSDQFDIPQPVVEGPTGQARPVEGAEIVSRIDDDLEPAHP